MGKTRPRYTASRKGAGGAPKLSDRLAKTALKAGKTQPSLTAFFKSSQSNSSVSAQQNTPGNDDSQDDDEIVVLSAAPRQIDIERPEKRPGGEIVVTPSKSQKTVDTQENGEEMKDAEPTVSDPAEKSPHREPANYDMDENHNYLDSLESPPPPPPEPELTTVPSDDDLESSPPPKPELTVSSDDDSEGDKREMPDDDQDASKLNLSKDFTKEMSVMNEYNWLILSVDGFVCKYCSCLHRDPLQTFDVKDGKYKGKVQFQSLLKRHEVSQKHLKAMQMYEDVSKEDMSKKPQRTPSKIAHAAIMDKLRIVYFTIKKHQSLTTMYKAFHEFCVLELGVKSLVDHKTALHSSYGDYLSSFSVWEFVDALATWIRDEKLARLRSKKNISVSLDESEDSSHREQMSLFCRSISNSGEIQVDFLDLLRVTGRTAQDLFDVIKKWFMANDFNIKNVTFCGMDTTNTMSGKKGGLQKKFKVANPHCLYVKCSNHKLALVFTHCGKQFELVLDFVDLMNQFYLFYKKSTRRRDLRTEEFKEMGQKELAPIKAVPTRWLSIEPQNRRIVDGYQAEVKSLIRIAAWKREDNVKAMISEFLRPEMIAMMLAMADILPDFNTVQTMMQKTALVFTDIKQMKQRLIETVNEVTSNICIKSCSCAKEVCHLGDFRSRLAWAKEQSEELGFVRHDYDRFDIGKFWREEFIPLLDMMEKEIDEALAFEDELEGFSFLNPQLFNFDPEKEDEVKSFGQSEFEKTVSYYASQQVEKVKVKGKETEIHTSFPKLSSKEKTMDEFLAAKKLICNFKKEFEMDVDVQCSMIESKLQKVDDEMTNEETSVRRRKKLRPKKKSLEKSLEETRKQEFTYDELLRKWYKSDITKSMKNMTFMMKMAALIPGSTAVVEASWSEMNLLCDAHSSHLTQKNLNNLMHCALFKGEVDFDAVLAIWQQKRKRKVSVDAVLKKKRK